MRVGIDLRLYSYRPAGIATYALNLARALARRPDEVELVVYQSRKTRQPLVKAETRILYTPCHHRFEQAALAVELFRAPIDLLHSPDFIPPFYRSFRSVISVHDLAFHFFPEFITAESRRYYGQIRRAIASADAVIVDAEAVRRDLERELGVPPERVDVIYLAPDEAFRPLPREQVEAFFAARGLPLGAIFWVGTFEGRKNVPGLLRAYARLRDAPPLLLAGRPGWLENEVERLISSLGLEGRVVFCWGPSQDDLVHLYNGASLFVFPSFYEGFGFPVLEAMACGTPVVSSNAGALAEVTGEGGLQVDPRDEEALAGAIDAVLGSSALANELRQRGFAHVARFSWDRCAEETLAVYRRVLG
ncbi:MAG: glycosyltransferase family 1 protein [Chloroflexota bacterium]|nr:glycosyltransferase family 4 protein [Dehalococcoidia bacterium]MDW8255237.1 glycosyltransferase family 1 protein [Chloroflexota bacterium]